MRMKRVTLHSVLLQIINENKTQKHLSAACFLAFTGAWASSQPIMKATGNSSLVKEYNRIKQKQAKNEKGMVRKKQKRL